MIGEKNSKADASNGLDDLFRNSLEGHRIEPSKGLWRGISRKLLRTELFHLNFTNLPGKFWFGVAGLTLVGLVFLVNRVDDGNRAGKESSPAVSGKGSQGRSSNVTSKTTPSLPLIIEKNINPSVQIPSNRETSIPDLNTAVREITKTKTPDYAMNSPSESVHSGLSFPAGTEKSFPGELNLDHAGRDLYGIDVAFMKSPGKPDLFATPPGRYNA